MSEREGPQTIDGEEERYLQALGQHIRAVRRAQGIGLEELSARVHMHRTHLWKIEKGRLNTRVVTLRRIASELHIDIGDLLLEKSMIDAELSSSAADDSSTVEDL